MPPMIVEAFGASCESDFFLRTYFDTATMSLCFPTLFFLKKKALLLTL